MNPVYHHLCLYESLLDGTLSLADVANMNDMIAVMEDNKWIAAHAAKE